jgi:hypothetical protein
MTNDEPLEIPPFDPEEWTDEQWLAWLKATDQIAGRDVDIPESVASRVAKSAPGQVLGQAMLGLAQAIYGKHDEDVTIVEEAPSDPTDDDGFIVTLDFENPERSAVIFRKDEGPASK